MQEDSIPRASSLQPNQLPEGRRVLPGAARFVTNPKVSAYSIWLVLLSGPRAQQRTCCGGYLGGLAVAHSVVQSGTSTWESLGRSVPAASTPAGIRSVRKVRIACRSYTNRTN
jgi:hypothetical protein